MYCSRSGARRRLRRCALPPLSAQGVGSGCCGRRPAGTSPDDRGGLATRARDSDLAMRIF